MSKENELATWGFIADICERILEGYPATMEEDIESLKENDENKFLTDVQRNCVLYTKCEKQMLL